MKFPLVGACLALLLHTMSALPLQQPAAKGSIEGVVTRGGTGTPIPGARVTLLKSGGGVGFGSSVSSSPTVTRGGNVAIATTVTESYQVASSSGVLSVTTDGQGGFAFKDLDPGSYFVTAGATGYSKQEYGQKTPGGQGKPVNLISGQTIKDLVIPLLPGGNITGRVHDNSGQPAVGVQVQILMPMYNALGQRTFRSGGLTRTDDRGEYRLYWITPGRYFLVAANGSTAINGAALGSPNELSGDLIPPTFYPGTVEISQATLIDVKPGSDVGGVDVFIGRQASYRIRGRVIDGRNGQVPQGVNITLSTSSFAGSISNININQSYNARDGSFEIRDVSPGPHTIRAQSMTSSTVVTPLTTSNVSAASAGSISLNVTSDLDGLVLTITNVVPILGRVSMDEPMPAGSPGLNQVRVQLRPSSDGAIIAVLGGPSPVSQPTAVDGSFRIDTVLPGEYRLSVTGFPADVYVKQARFNQEDVLNKPMQFNIGDTGTLEIVLSNRGGQINGTVADEKQNASQGIQVVLIPERQRDRVELYKTAIADANGRFTIRGIASGDYRVFAWEAIDPFAYFDPDLLKQFEQKGKPVHIAESSKETIDVRVIPAEP